MIYTVKQVAQTLQVCDRTVKNWLRDEKIKGFKVGRGWRITSEELERIKGGK